MSSRPRANNIEDNHLLKTVNLDTLQNDIYSAKSINSCSSTASLLRDYEPNLFVRSPQSLAQPSLTPLSGDSYSQTGYVFSAGLPSTANPLGNPTLPGYTTSGGVNWVGSLLTTYKPAGRTLLSYNFAYGGATTDASLVTPFDPSVESFIDQVNLFRQNLLPSTLWTSANTMFAVWMGVNDVGNGWYQSNWNTLYPQILNQYFAQLQIIYNAGGRQFTLLTVPPIQRTPAMLLQSTDSQNGEAVAIAQFNTLLQSKATSFQTSNKGSKVYVFDTQVPFNTALNNPTAYGAKDASCYDASGTVCLW